MHIKRILVPVDGSELSERAIETSVALAGQLGAAIVGFAAVVPSSFLSRANQSSGIAPASEFSDDDQDAGAAAPVLARFEAAALAAGVAFEGVVEEVPRVDKAIISAAAAHRCDMIIMVTRGRGAFGEFLFGSQTKAVLASGTLPLLVLH